MLKFIVLLAAMLSLPAHAGFGTGFVTGAVVGSVASSGSSAAARGNSLYASDKTGRNIIVCCTSWDSDFLMCERYGTKHTPAQFTKKAGYTYLYSRAFLKTGSGCDMIVMEVGN